MFKAAFVCYYLFGLLCLSKGLHGGSDKLLYDGQGSQHVNANRMVNNTAREKRDRDLGIHIAVAFSTFLGKSFKGLTSNQTIIFDNVLLNDGDGYNPTTGVFTAPISGVYSFQYTIANTRKGLLNCVLTAARRPVSYANADATRTDDLVQSGNSVILMLTKGQEVKLQYVSGDSWIFSSSYEGYSTLSGFLHYVV